MDDSKAEKSTLAMAWSLLDSRERRNLWVVVAVAVVAVLASVVMVSSIMPFLTVLADPGRIQEVGPLKWAYEAGGFNSSYDFVVALGLASIAIILVGNALQILRVYVLTRYAVMRGHGFSLRLLSSYLRRPYAYFATHNSGNMGTRVLSESQQVVQQFFRPVVELFAALSTLVGLVALLVYVNPLVSIATFAVFGGVYGVALLVTRPLARRLGRVRAATNAQRFRVTNEAFGGIKDVKVVGRERAYLDRYAIPSLKMNRTIAKIQAISQIPKYVMQAAAFAGMIVLCLILVRGRGLDTGGALAEILPTLGLIAFAGQRMIPELSKTYQGLIQLTYARSAVHAVYEDMTAETDIDRLPKRPPAAMGLSQDIVFDNVTFYYDAEGKSGIENVSFRIAAGERIGMVGSTGSGKSTIANILLGLYFPTSGQFRVDGTAIDRTNVRAWQSTVGYVPQEIFLSDASVRANIAFGVPEKEIDDESVVQAARIAQIHDFVANELDSGFETSVGERGVRLSGGQRQRIGIARALYNDANLLILDEATSALDNLTEAGIMRSVETLPGDKTIIMIAHRLSTLHGCDRILVLDRGRVAAFASWDDLLRTNALFRRLANGATSEDVSQAR